MRPGLGFVLIMLTALSTAQAETIKGKDLALRSTGRASGDGWTLDRNGYVGTYVRLDSAGKVDVRIERAGGADAKTNIVVADEAAEAASHAFDLPAGTWFVRVELVNAPAKSNRNVTIRGIDVRGATVLNEHTDANALAAANSYIAHFRRGRATVKLPGDVRAGTEARVKLTRHVFSFGTAVAGFETSELLAENPPAGSDPARYQEVIKKHFNAIVPGNAGKWVYNEKERDVVTMRTIDRVLGFARENNLRARMHTMLWDTGQQPQFVQDLLKKAADGDAAAKKELREEISERIQYYVRERATGYGELDVLNEVYHQPRFLNIFGVEGLADIYAEVGRAVAEAGADTQLYVNEFNVFQWSQLPAPFGDKEQWDPYANWLREHAEQLKASGGTVHGIGVQYYVDPDPTKAQPHSPARIFGALQNLSVGGWRITLTEFGAKTGADESLTTDALEHTVRLVFGTPGASGFMMWGIWETEMWDKALGAAFYDKQWRPRQPAQRWEALARQWDTDVTLPVREDGTIEFTGFYGDYEITVGGKGYPLTLTKGKAEYAVEAR
jgi:GH35 family endo-1,4-beta-xylanase